MATVAELLHCARALPGDSARRDAEILLGHCLQKSRSWLYTWPELEVDGAMAARYRQLLSERNDGAPVAYLTGSREFWSLSLTVNEHTLIPRPDTEKLVEWALQLPLPASARVLDLGTGSGAIALALAQERGQWQVTALDASEQALRVAQGNADKLGLERVRLLRSDWFQAVAGERFDLLVSNPPYVAADDPHLDRGDLRFEPSQALVAAQQGMADLARLAEAARRHLLPGGWVLLEHGFEQAAGVRELLRRGGLQRVQTQCDLAGLERITGGCSDAE